MRRCIIEPPLADTELKLALFPVIPAQLFISLESDRNTPESGQMLVAPLWLDRDCVVSERRDYWFGSYPNNGVGMGRLR